jgi:hypothetical protein
VDNATGVRRVAKDGNLGLARSRTAQRKGARCTSVAELAFFVGHAVRAPALAWYRPVKGAALTGLPDLARRRASIRCHFLWQIARELRPVGNVAPWRPSSLGASAASRPPASLRDFWVPRFPWACACSYSLYIKCLVLPFSFCWPRCNDAFSVIVRVTSGSLAGLSERAKHRGFAATSMDGFTVLRKTSNDPLVSRPRRDPFKDDSAERKREPSYGEQDPERAARVYPALKPRQR